MNSLKKYIPCLILSLILVFSSLGTSAVIIVNEYASADKLIELTEENEIVPMIKTQLEKHFSDEYNATGIPVEVYAEAMNEQYINSVLEKYIADGFAVLEGEPYATDTAPTFKTPVNEALEADIKKFFSDYAESINYEKDDNYNNKVDFAISSAYNVIGEQCDIYKLKTINNEGLLTKAKPIYHNLGVILLACLAVTVLLIIIIVLINIKSLTAVLYWIGVSSLISGVIGIIPCLYLNATNYFDAFVIKQPQIFTAFTGLMYNAVDSFMMNQIILAVLGVILIIAYPVIRGLEKKEN